jgi:hypothetical protein
MPLSMVVTDPDVYRDSRELVAELEFVWDQIKHNSASSSNSSPPRGGAYTGSGRRFTAPMSGSEGPMKVLSPMSQDDEADREHVKRLVEGEDGSDDEFQDENKKKTTHWRTKVESTLVKMTAEVAALREQIASGREWRDKRRRTIGAWLSWLIFGALKLVVVDGFILMLILIWMRKRRDRRLEDLVREYLRLGRGYIRRFLPPR